MYQEILIVKKKNCLDKSSDENSATTKHLVSWQKKSHPKKKVKIDFLTPEL